ncbi:hypothetical protein DPMN_168182 [Dreissena polymorpha]|uniref:Uncharacterized protein n=1 Tax=Dreissena polymorpha TaxID=45954 RepID=A0A9D4F276_DREPO|nr:hypothetical protein DPMN_168182 [Dreissena polymorpha]
MGQPRWDPCGAQLHSPSGSHVGSPHGAHIGAHIYGSHIDCLLGINGKELKLECQGIKAMLTGCYL